MPTTRPRYTVTDTGDLSGMLDLAQRRWPDVGDRRELLLRLAAAGRDAVAAELSDHDRRRERQERALARAPGLLDVDALLRDEAWH